MKLFLKSRFTHYWLPVIIYCAAIYIQSSFPTTQGLPSWRHLDKLLHLAAYTILGALFFRALSSGGGNLKRAVIFSILFTGLYGLSDEIHQAFVPGRSPEATDVAADFAGGIVGVGWGWSRLKRIDKSVDLL